MLRRLIDLPDTIWGKHPDIVLATFLILVALLAADTLT